MSVQDQPISPGVIITDESLGQYGIDYWKYCEIAVDKMYWF